MATTKELVATSQSNSSKGSAVYATSDTRQAAGNGRSLLLPDESGKIDTWIVYLKVIGGSGKVQWTIDESLNEWADWDAGTVTSDTSDVLHGIKAVRAVNVSGTVDLYVRAY